MAVQEYEPQFDAAIAEEEISPLDSFKTGLHGMVTELEAAGSSAFGHLMAVRGDLKRRQIQLMKESYSSDHTAEKLAELQEEMIQVYHKLVWTEGYIRDRQSKP